MTQAPAPTLNARDNLQIKDADRPPTAEELLVLCFVAGWARTKAKLFPLIADIDACLMPSPAADARSNCEQFGWLSRGRAATQVPTGARMVTQLGKEVLAAEHNWASALEMLDMRLREQEARRRQFKRSVEHTDIPRLKEMRERLVKAGPEELAGLAGSGSDAGDAGEGGAEATTAARVAAPRPRRPARPAPISRSTPPRRKVVPTPVAPAGGKRNPRR